jgi:methionine-rich copper-binding protein CopC
VLCLFSYALLGQNEPHHNTIAGIGHFSSAEKVTDARISSAKKIIQDEYISEAFLDASNGFVGIVFSEKVKKPNIYYKIVDEAGREVYNGSAHANQGTNPTMYYNTQNLPSGNYRIFIENDKFFMSTSFIK